MGINDKAKEYNKNLLEYLEFRNMINLSELVIKSAINRTESRGAHFRSDYPEENNYFEKNSIVKFSNNEIELSYEDSKWKLV